ncbi:MAG TPA: hypothetical protein VFV67_34750 [Actinophytocola sp.]|uniref:AbiTii domain-containing protein n=1 Tax=Actinophytocola sp. TaxID=1872138 RepID=UPI002DBCF683|nr:hypothetical protein [Actinophytocola sp.]HEU5475825.1 hypothetical protein [Actinophytocola sp.]
MNVMTLLDEIIESASGDDVPVSSLLRKVKVLASRIGTGDLAKWVEHELVGYSNSDELPSYRGPFEAEVLGHFSGPMGSGLNNAPIPPSAFPENLREGYLFKVAFPQPIAELQELGKAKSADNLGSPWPADAISMTNYMLQQGRIKLYPYMGLMQATRRVSPQQLSAIIDTVRSRVLDLALTLEGVSPGVGERGTSKIDTATAQTIINNIYGGSNNVAIQSSDFHQEIAAPPRGDEAALISSLASIGISESQIGELRDALRADREEAGGQAPDTPGPRVNAWLGKLTLGAANASGKIATSAIGGVVGGLIKSYFGIA